MQERGSGVLSDFLVTAPQSESSNQIAECVIICDDIGNRARDLVCMQCMGNDILYAVLTLPRDKKLLEHQTLFQVFRRVWAHDYFLVS